MCIDDPFCYYIYELPVIRTEKVWIINQIFVHFFVLVFSSLFHFGIELSTRKGDNWEARYGAAGCNGSEWRWSVFDWCESQSAGNSSLYRQCTSIHGEWYKLNSFEYIAVCVTFPYALPFRIKFVVFILQPEKEICVIYNPHWIVVNSLLPKIIVHQENQHHYM